MNVDNFVFLDMEGTRAEGTQSDMGLTRHGIIAHVYFSRETAVSADIFIVPEVAREFFDSDDWEEVHTDRDLAAPTGAHGLGA